MDTLRLATEILITTWQQVVHSNTHLVLPESVFEVSDPPSIILQGPTIRENKSRRSQVFRTERDIPNLTYTRTPAPRLYHLDFEITVTTASSPELLGFQERIARFYRHYPELAIADRGNLTLTEITPLGGLARPNLSNLKQSSGRLRLEDCPVFDGRIETGSLIKDRIFEFRDLQTQDLIHKTEESP